MVNPNDAKNIIIRNLTDENRLFLEQLRKQTNCSYNNKALMFAAEEYMRLLEVNAELLKRNNQLNLGLQSVKDNLQIIEDSENTILSAKSETTNLIKQLNETA